MNGLFKENFSTESLLEPASRAAGVGRKPVVGVAATDRPSGRLSRQPVARKPVAGSGFENVAAEGPVGEMSNLSPDLPRADAKAMAGSNRKKATRVPSRRRPVGSSGNGNGASEPPRRRVMGPRAPGEPHRRTTVVNEVEAGVAGLDLGSADTSTSPERKKKQPQRVVRRKPLASDVADSQSDMSWDASSFASTQASGSPDRSRGQRRSDPDEAAAREAAADLSAQLDAALASTTDVSSAMSVLSHPGHNRSASDPGSVAEQVDDQAGRGRLRGRWAAVAVPDESRHVEPDRSHRAMLSEPGQKPPSVFTRNRVRSGSLGDEHVNAPTTFRRLDDRVSRSGIRSTTRPTSLDSSKILPTRQRRFTSATPSMDDDDDDDDDEDSTDTPSRNNDWKYHILKFAKDMYMTTNPDRRHLADRPGPSYYIDADVRTSHDFTLKFCEGERTAVTVLSFAGGFRVSVAEYRTHFDARELPDDADTFALDVGGAVWYVGPAAVAASSSDKRRAALVRETRFYRRDDPGRALAAMRRRVPLKHKLLHLGRERIRAHEESDDDADMEKVGWLHISDTVRAHETCMWYLALGLTFAVSYQQRLASKAQKKLPWRSTRHD